MIQRAYLIAAIALFLLLLIPYFENIAVTDLLFFGKTIPFHTGFRLFVVGGMILGYLITILVQGFIQNVKDSVNKNKFEM